MPQTDCQVHLLPQMVEAGQLQLQFHVPNGKGRCYSVVSRP